jgi:plasmid stabilization system protein ParE
MKIVHIQPEAEADLDEAYSWYASRSRALADALTAEFLAMSAMLAERAEAFTEVVPGARRALLSRFPYSVIYVVEADRIEIVAVVHSHRDPEVWKRRL